MFSSAAYSDSPIPVYFVTFQRCISSPSYFEWKEETARPGAMKRFLLCENNKQDAPYRLIYYSKSALHVSGDIFAHNQEHLTVFTVSASVHPSCCHLVSWMSFQLNTSCCLLVSWMSFQLIQDTRRQQLG